MSHHSYKQPQKQIVRKRILSQAVRLLTTERSRAPIVLPDELRQVLTYSLGILHDQDLAIDAEREFGSWIDFYNARIGTKRPSDLKVLYLCGPEPLNDVNILLDQQVSPHNIWGIESQYRSFSQAIRDVERSGLPIKLHHGSLSEFFSTNAESFDIIYYDSCGAFLAKKPDTLDPIVKLLSEHRLEPLSILITNFAEISDEQSERMAEVLTAYFRFRHRDLPGAFEQSGLDPAECVVNCDGLKRFIQGNSEPFYSDFITRLIVDLARFWIPNCRALASEAVSRNYLATNKDRNKVLSEALHVPRGAGSISEWVRRAGDMVLAPDSYPIWSFYRDLCLLKDPLVDQLGDLKINGREIRKLLPLASMLDHVVEGHWDCLSADMLEAVRCPWFDRSARFSCDSPLPNLLISSLLGSHGHPWYPNPRGSCRLKYRAKSKTMFTDLFLLDECRYFFDWFPSVQLVPARFGSQGFQVLARCILDRIGRADSSSDSHPLRGSAVAGRGEIPYAMHYNFGPRETVCEPEVN